MTARTPLEDRLRAHFEDEADEAGIDRLLKALETGAEAHLSPDERATLAEYRRDGGWSDARRHRRRAVVGVVALAAAALIAVFAWRDPPEPGLTPMGQPFALHVTVARDGVLRPVGDITLATGDRLGLAYTAPAGHLRVLAISADGAAPLHPLDGSTAVDGGERIPLPAGAVLTPAAGCEWIVGLYSVEPIPLDRALAAASSALTAARDGPCTLGPIDLPAVDVVTVELRR